MKGLVKYEVRVEHDVGFYPNFAWRKRTRMLTAWQQTNFGILT